MALQSNAKLHAVYHHEQIMTFAHPCYLVFWINLEFLDILMSRMWDDNKHNLAFNTNNKLIVFDTIMKLQCYQEMYQ